MIKSLALDYSAQPKLAIKVLSPLKTKKDLSLAYTPGIAEVSKAVTKDTKNLYRYTFKRNNLAVISDGSAVLGLGNIGHQGSYPVMEGKAMLFARFGGINAIPIIVKTQDVDEFVSTVVNIADSFGAINLEDISAPRCFEIEAKLRQALDIPLMHDDQHGTAIVVLAALKNALKLIPKQGKKTKIVIVGAGAAGVGVTKLLLKAGYREIVICDSKGIVSKKRGTLNPVKKDLVKITNPNNLSGNIQSALTQAHVLIGVAQANIIRPADIKLMAKEPIIFAMSNPVPEIMPKLAYRAGAGIVGTGRSDFKNQINNALVFPGLFRGAIDARSQINDRMKLAAVTAIVSYHEKKLSPNRLLPEVLDPKVHQAVAKGVCAAGS